MQHALQPTHNQFGLGYVCLATQVGDRIMELWIHKLTRVKFTTLTPTKLLEEIDTPNLNHWEKKNQEVRRRAGE